MQEEPDKVFIQLAIYLGSSLFTTSEDNQRVI